MTEYSIIGKSVNRVDALAKVTGKAEFPISFQLPRMLHGKIVRSPYPHAKIVNIDTSTAERLPGVKAVITAINTPPLKLGGVFRDRYLFPADLVARYVGDAVAAVAAVTEAIAEEAADLIEVEYEELPAVFETEKAFQKEPPAVVHPKLTTYECRLDKKGIKWQLDPERPNVCEHFRIRQGDVEKGFQEADFIIEDRYYTPRIQHCQLEPCVSVAWFDADGTLRLRTSTQSAQVIKDEICDTFNISPRKVRVECPYIGGSFGGKVGSVAEPYAVLLSMKTGGRPVRICFTREEHFHSGRSRVPVVTYIKDGVKKDGTIVARQIKILVDMGAYADSAIMISRNCAFGTVGTYKIANFKLDSYGVYTNTPKSVAYRGFGSAETIWAVENQMDVIADKVGLNPVAVRKKHILKEGDRDACGQIVHSIGVEQGLEQVQKWIGWGEEPSPQDGPWKSGKGIALGNKYTNPAYPSSALVKVHPDGSIEVRHSSHEIGMGVDTVVAQIAAESFGIDIDQIKVVSGDTDVCPYGFAPVSSRETFHTGNAVLRACEDAKRQLYEIAAPKLGVPAAQLETRDRKVCIKGHPGKEMEIRELFRPPGVGHALSGGEIIGKYTFMSPFIPEDPETGQSERIVSYYSYIAQAVEVAVDVETGKVKVLRSAGCFDMGTPINPKMCEAQIESGIAMGIGSALYEELVMSDGVILNPSFVDYKVPSAECLPNTEDLAALLAGAPHREGPFGAKGLGEGVMIPYPPAVSNAIYNAVGVRIKELPITSEKVLRALKEKER
ncbi:xanthine dehydrogenase family protein molybdopterin-binding subunit [Chloroflexota bacterium]